MFCSLNISSFVNVFLDEGLTLSEHIIAIWIFLHSRILLFSPTKLSLQSHCSLQTVEVTLLEDT